MKTEALGATRWVIAEGWIPDHSTGPEPAMTSHETACMLNTSDQIAHVAIMVYFADREPLGPFRLEVGARRTLHQRFNDLTEPGRIPHATDYACVIESDVPIVVQHTRIDTRQEANALMTTMAYAAPQ